MSRNFIEEVTLNRESALSTAQAIITRAETENRQLTEVERSELDAHEGMIQSLTERLGELREVERTRNLAERAESNSNAWRTTHRQPGTSTVRGEAIDKITSSRTINDATKNNCVRAIESDSSDKIATVARATGDPHYVSAFAKMMRDPDRGHMTWTAEEQRAFTEVQNLERAMAIGSTGAGGAAVPFVLDPVFTVTGAGAINPMRSLATLKTTASLPRNHGRSGQRELGQRGLGDQR